MASRSIASSRRGVQVGRERVQQLRSKVVNRYNASVQRFKNRRVTLRSATKAVPSRAADRPTTIEGDDQEQLMVRPPAPRYGWSWGAEGFMAIIAYALNVTALTQLPYYCMKYGALAFFWPCLLMLLFCCVPLYYVQLTLGQYSGYSAITVWHSVPLLQGIGYAAVLITFVVTLHQSALIAWLLRYLIAFLINEPQELMDSCVLRPVNNNMSLQTNKSDWSPCLEPLRDWLHSINNTRAVTDAPMALNYMNMSFRLAAETFFHDDILNLATHIPNDAKELTSKSQNLVFIFCLLAVWIVMCVKVAQSARSAAKFSEIFLLLSGLLFVIMFIYILTSSEGRFAILMYFVPRFQQLTAPQFIYDAAMFTFNLLFSSWGTVVTLGSYYKATQHNPSWDAILAPFLALVFAFDLALIPVCLVNVLAHHLGIDDMIDRLNDFGPRLLFVLIPQSLALFPLGRWFACVFYLMALFIGSTTLLWQFDTVVTACLDLVSEKTRRWYIRLSMILMTAILAFAISLIMVSNYGLYIQITLDTFSGRWVFLILGFVELMAVCYGYGLSQLLRDAHVMSGSKPFNWIWQVLCKAFAPIILLILIIYSIVVNILGITVPAYGNFEFTWVWITAGYVIMLVPLMMLLLCIMPVLATTPGTSFARVLQKTVKPDQVWHEGADHRYGQARQALASSEVVRRDQRDAERRDRQTVNGANRKERSDFFLGIQNRISAATWAIKPGKINRGTQITRDVSTQTGDHHATYPPPPVYPNIPIKDTAEISEHSESRLDTSGGGRSTKKHRKKKNKEERKKKKERRSESRGGAGGGGLPPISENRSHNHQRSTNGGPPPIDQPNADDFKLPPLTSGTTGHHHHQESRRTSTSQSRSSHSRQSADGHVTTIASTNGGGHRGKLTHSHRHRTIEPPSSGDSD